MVRLQGPEYSPSWLYCLMASLMLTVIGLQVAAMVLTARRNMWIVEVGERVQQERSSLEEMIEQLR